MSSIPKELKYEVVTRWLPATEAAWKVALYNNASALALTSYSATNEIIGTGYTAAGATLTGRAGAYSGENVILDAADTSWSGATFSATHAIIYYANGSTNPVRARFDFGGTKSVSTGTFTVIWNSGGVVRVS